MACSTNIPLNENAPFKPLFKNPAMDREADHTAPMRRNLLPAGGLWHLICVKAALSSSPTKPCIYDHIEYS